jgi:hypothetical protein
MDDEYDVISFKKTESFFEFIGMGIISVFMAIPQILLDVTVIIIAIPIVLIFEIKEYFTT